jgi:hypothetical protein
MGVEPTFTAVVIMETTNAFFMPTVWKKVEP